MDAARHGPVLVVDDYAINRLLLERVFELEQIKMIGAATIAEAERVLEHTTPPVIVIDLQLPDGCGLDLARRIKADPVTAACEVVAVTAGRRRNEAQLAYAVGCAAFVTKPLDTLGFAHLVSSLIAPAPARTRPGRSAA
jgi:CheY-like chemotaxis protein